MTSVELTPANKGYTLQSFFKSNLKKTRDKLLNILLFFKAFIWYSMSNKQKSPYLCMMVIVWR